MYRRVAASGRVALHSAVGQGGSWKGCAASCCQAAAYLGRVALHSAVGQGGGAAGDRYMPPP